MSSSQGVPASHQCSLVAAIATPWASGPTYLLNSWLKSSSPGENTFFGITLSSAIREHGLLTSGITPLLSVGSIVSASLGGQSWRRVCKNFSMARIAPWDAKSNSLSSTVHTVDEDPHTKNQSSKARAPKVAFFDVDGTITRTNVVLAYFTHRITELSFIVKLFWIPWFALSCIFYLIIDSVNRAIFNRVFYQSYRGRSVQSKKQMAELIYRNYYRPRIFSGAVDLIRKLKQDGYQIVFVTGCLDFLIAPLAKELGADFVYAAELVEENGRFTGQLKGMASSNAEKAERVRDYAKNHGVSLADSLAFGDSVADLPMLEIVGHPHAVNPDARLQVLAEKRGWPVINWGLKPTLVSAIAA
ncbi:hypothetical protein GOP47_0019586 [Adiantum capillus-veneris]|uniref:HAD-IB family hydrolase n=1 Tax=Adiantum capillus-veneris TaxID=13818 RepID=A0A9D4UD24_ADICA|nr:hypothetical protein GOP47_0019586 [Adiantum capillus-veneris]